MSGFILDRPALYVDGGWLEPAEGVTESIINPATELSIATVAVGGEKEVDAAIAAARRAFDEGPWPQMSMAERCDAMQRFHDLLAARADELEDLVIAEIGSAKAIARRMHVDTPLDILQTCIDLGRQRESWQTLPPRLVPNRHGDGTTLGAVVKVREPIGVVSAITPFNFPFFLNIAKVAPAMVVGCTMVLKPSPLTPLQALLLGDIATEAGLPKGVLNVVTGGVEVGEQLTTDERVDLVTFTGSDIVGAAVMGQAAPSLKKVLLELGGKSAMIVMPDADVGAAAAEGVRQIIIQAGQGCALWTRHIVHRSIRDDYLDAARAVLQRIKVGDPSQPDTMVGPLIREAQRDRVERYVAEGIADGATVAVGGKRPDGLDTGWFYEPTLLAGVTAKMSVAQDEIFGPVGVVLDFDTPEEAVAIANDSRYGLSGGIWSGDPGGAFQLALQLRTGAVSINGGDGGFDARVPFGGYKRSGIGREFGQEGLDEYCELKAIKFHAG